MNLDLLINPTHCAPLERGDLTCRPSIDISLLWSERGLRLFIVDFRIIWTLPMHSQPPKSPTPLIRGKRQRRRSPNPLSLPYQGETPCQGSCRGTLATSRIGKCPLIFSIHYKLHQFYTCRPAGAWDILSSRVLYTCRPSGAK